MVYFSDFGDSEDDEEVFLSEEFNNKNNNNESKKIIPGVDGILDSSKTNDIQEQVTNSLTIPNLIFENKNLLKTDAKGYDVYDYNSSVLSRSETDENGNLGTHETSMSSAVHITNKMLDEVKTVFTNTDACEEFEENENVISQCTKKSDTKQIYKPEKSKGSQIRTRQTINETDTDFSFFQIEWLFLVSAFTLISLFIDMSPETFIFYVFIGQLLYCLIRFVLKDT